MSQFRELSESQNDMQHEYNLILNINPSAQVYKLPQESRFYRSSLD